MRIRPILWSLLLLTSCLEKDASLVVEVIGEGTVALTQDGNTVRPDCGDDEEGAIVCAAELKIKDTTARLTATPEDGWEFVGWSGQDCDGTDPSIEVTWREASDGSLDLSCTAEFTESLATLAITLVGPTGQSGGYVQADDLSFTCAYDGTENSNCAPGLAPGSAVALQARSVDPAIHFVGWSGACTGSDPEACDFVMPAEGASVTATFEESVVVDFYGLNQYGTAVVTSGNAVYSAGSNSQGQAGLGVSATEAEVPTLVPGMQGKDVAAVFSGSFANSVGAVLGNGEAWGWGRNSNGMLGTGTTTTAYDATRIAGSETLAVDTSFCTGGTCRSVAFGTSFACYVLDDLTVSCAGDNNVGQLGAASPATSSALVAVAGLTDVREVAASSNSACAIHGTGSVSCWGSNTVGQLGRGTDDNLDHPTPEAISGLTDARRIVGDDTAFCAIDADGDLLCWGDDVLAPAAVTLPGDAVGVTFTSVSKHVLLDTGVVYSWGTNFFGEFGTGSPGASATPVAGAFPADVVAIAGGNSHLCALTEGGEVWCSGANDWNQCGQATWDTDRHDTPRQFLLPSAP